MRREKPRPARIRKPGHSGAAITGRVDVMPDQKIQGRADRLKAALRENLKRRKAQARGREAGSGTAPGETGPDDRTEPRDMPKGSDEESGPR